MGYPVSFHMYDCPSAAANDRAPSGLECVGKPLYGSGLVSGVIDRTVYIYMYCMNSNSRVQDHTTTSVSSHSPRVRCVRFSVWGIGSFVKYELFFLMICLRTSVKKGFVGVGAVRSGVLKEGQCEFGEELTVLGASRSA